MIVLAAFEVFQVAGQVDFPLALSAFSSCTAFLVPVAMQVNMFQTKRQRDDETRGQPFLSGIWVPGPNPEDVLGLNPFLGLAQYKPEKKTTMVHG